jgi:hypothetical protein
LWSLEQPNLYKFVTEVESGGIVTDRYETPFGIRSIQFDPANGLFLNGKPVTVKGTCNHQDHAGLGVAGRRSAFPDSKTPGDGLQCVPHLAQSAHAGASRCLRLDGNARGRRNAHDVFES